MQATLAPPFILTFSVSHLPLLSWLTLFLTCQALRKPTHSSQKEIKNSIKNLLDVLDRNYRSNLWRTPLQKVLVSPLNSIEIAELIMFLF